jgi:Ala-tRNA(Pro) deacylase
MLEASETSYERMPHHRTMTAAAEARAVGIDPAHIGKTLVLASEGGFVRAVVPATERINLKKVRALLERDVSLASAQTLADAYPDFELGAVPPIGGAKDDLVLFDQRVSDAGFVVFDAGTHNRSLRMSAADLVALADARIADICED